eukprot:6412966-Alexandrium_andersonii.AAC.1
MPGCAGGPATAGLLPGLPAGGAASQLQPVAPPLASQTARPQAGRAQVRDRRSGSRGQSRGCPGARSWSAGRG